MSPGRIKGRQNGVNYGNYKIFPDRSGASDVPFRREMLQ